jgi:drug/metabolite transporter (DMT)-like permease
VNIAHIPHAGEILSVLAAVVWSVSVVLFRVSGRRMTPFNLNFFKNAVATLLLLATLAVIGMPLVRAVPLSDYLLLFLAGFLGITIADTLFFHGLNLVGAGLSQVVGCAYPPSVILLSFLFLGERLTWGDLAGTAFILAGIFLSTRHEPPEGTTRADLRRGILIGTASMVIMAIGVVITKPVLDRSPVLWATTVRLLGGVFTMMLITAFSRRHRSAWRTFIPSRTWKLTVPASIMGAYLAMIIWLGGMKFTQASTASILNQTSAIFVLPVAAIVLGERITRQKLLAVILGVAGVALVTLL